MEIQALMDTIVRIAQVSYLPEHRYTPWLVLQLYYELLQHCVPHPHVLIHMKLFNSYLNNTSCHAGPQFKLVSLSSCNTEFKERLFGQANRVAECCTNRQPANNLQEMFIRLQVILAQVKVRVKVQSSPRHL